MLLLTESDIEICYMWSEQRPQPFPTLKYQDKSFLEVPRTQDLNREQAIVFARTIYEQTEGKGLILVVEGKPQQTGNPQFKVWREAPQLARAFPVVDMHELVQRFQLPEVLQAMKRSPQLEQSNQRRGLRQYSGCFTGQAATEFLMHHYDLSQANAMRLGQRLLQEHLIGAIGSQTLFTNGALFYRFR
jgi:hypothetical protein